MELLQRPGELPLALDPTIDPRALDNAEIAKFLPPELMEFLEAQMAQMGLGFSSADLVAMLIDYLTTKESEQRTRPQSFNSFRPSGNSGTPSIRSVGNSWSGGGGGGGGGGGSSSSGSTGTSTPVTTRAQLPPGENLNGLKIQIIGDSLMEGAKGKTADALRGNGAASVDVDSSVGRSITSSGAGNNMSPAEIRQKVEQSGANVVVLELGTNPSDYARQIPETMNELSKIQPPPLVVWVNTQSQSSGHGSYGQDYFNGNAATNQILAEEAKKRPNMVIADWSSIGGGSGINAGDGLHLTDAGSQAMADLILQTIAGARSQT